MTERRFAFDVRGAPSSAVVHPAEPGPPRGTLVLAPGAGSRQNQPFLVALARALRSGGPSARGFEVVTFDFLYAHAGRRLPDRSEVLEDTWTAVLDAIRGGAATAARPLVIGGKSMGGRMATHVAASGTAGAIDGLVLLGYPLHPPDKPASLRVAHLPKIREPMLFLQGTRDAFGAPEELRPHVSAPGMRARVVEIEGADHSLALPKRAGGSATSLDRVATEIAAFMASLAPTA